MLQRCTLDTALAEQKRCWGSTAVAVLGLSGGVHSAAQLHSAHLQLGTQLAYVPFND